MKITLPTIHDLYKAGAHFGHLRANSHPKARAYTYNIFSKVQVIDLEKTRESLKNSLDALAQMVKEGKKILFIGTKRQAKDLVSKVASKHNYPFVAFKWLGGTLTNYATIKQNTQRLKDMREVKGSDEYKAWSKKRKVSFNKKLEKFEKLFAGIVNLDKLPEAVFIVDPAHEEVALTEARRIGAKVFALMDTNSNPEEVDYPIFANDDSIKTIELVLNLVDKTIAKAVKAPKAVKGKNES